MADGQSARERHPEIPDGFTAGMEGIDLFPAR